LPGGDRPKVVFCTTENDVAHIARALHAGANDYIMKPFDKEIVEAKFQEVGLICACCIVMAHLDDRAIPARPFRARPRQPQFAIASHDAARILLLSRQDSIRSVLLHGDAGFDNCARRKPALCLNVSPG
jgi:DNA-binding NarL/FixJ family response regulator